MAGFPLISICIPAYKRVVFLKRLLDSIAMQTFTNFEVIITDDSPNEEVKQLADIYLRVLPLKYFKNTVALGTPENWNEAMRKTSGEWIKIMHDDDWFADESSLQNFADAVSDNNGYSFVFSAYSNVHEDSGKIEKIRLSKVDENKLKKNYFSLVHRNYIGNPSCTLFRKKPEIVFDNRFKWVVDFEFYMRYLKNDNNVQFKYLDKTLINISVNDSQVTKSAFRDPKIEIPENHLLLDEIGHDKLRDIYVYDYFWRLYRNLSIKEVSQIQEHGYMGSLHPVLASMIKWQRIFPGAMLEFGPLSKILMGFHYITHRFLI